MKKPNKPPSNLSLRKQQVEHLRDMWMEAHAMLCELEKSSHDSVEDVSMSALLGWRLNEIKQYIEDGVKKSERALREKDTRTTSHIAYRYGAQLTNEDICSRILVQTACTARDLLSLFKADAEGLVRSLRDPKTRDVIRSYVNTLLQ